MAEPTPAVGALRCFLAIDVGDGIRRALTETIRSFRSTSADVRWVREEGLHLTLAFLGSVAPEALPPIERAAARSVAPSAPIELTVRGVGGFPRRGRPRVLWAGVAGAGLGALAEALSVGLEPLGFAPEKREFRPHVTLGRLRSGRGWKELAPRVRAAETRNFGSCKVFGVHAYRSDLRRDGAVYTKLWTVQLMGDDDGGE